MKKILAAIIVLTVFSNQVLMSQTKTDSIKIVETSLDYLEGWYNGDTLRMERALHPDLVKRQFKDGLVINSISKSIMLGYTKAGYGKKTPRELLKNEVRILDISENVASVKTISVAFIDYLQLVKVNNQWKILNVLWVAK